MIITNSIYFALSAIALIVSGIYLVKSLSSIARYLGISEFSAAFIIMAFATSIPELFVGISSALSGNSALSLGNIIGANIIDLTLITGIIILGAKQIKFKSRRLGNDTYFMLIAILFLILLYSLGNQLSRIDGVLLIGLFSFHVYRVFKKRKKYKKAATIRNHKPKRFWALIIFLLSLIGLFISSTFAVKYATNLAIDLNLPNIMIGLFLLALATTLPELIFGISATHMRHKEMAIGDQIGTIVANTLLVLGIVAIISPIQAEFSQFIISSIFMFVSAFILVTFIKTGKKLEKSEGISLILIYVLFIVIELFLK